MKTNALAENMQAVQWQGRNLLREIVVLRSEKALLLAACEEVLEHLEYPWSDSASRDALMAELRHAIAKAKGDA